MNRTSQYPIQPLILSRWSSRCMNGEPISNEELHSLFEAARWAPSAYNNQPWRFLYAKKGTPYWDQFFNFLVEFNQSWCHQAAVLGLICSKTTFDKNHKPSRTHAFDTGAAWENFSLEGTARGLVVHGMEGFDYEKASALLPKDFEVQAMFALGRPGKKESLPKELLEREKPSDRKPIHEFAFEGHFPPYSDPI